MRQDEHMALKCTVFASSGSEFSKTAEDKKMFLTMRQ